jgi:hypothetical protein
LLPVIETFKNEPQTAIIQPKILDFKIKHALNMQGCGGFIDQYGYPYLGRLLNIEKDMGQYDDEINILGFRSLLFYRSVVYKSYGLMMIFCPSGRNRSVLAGY